MQMQTKSASVTFTHSDDFRGDVVIVRNGETVTVPMDALRKLVAEAVRFDAYLRLSAAKPEALLRGLV